MRELHGWHGDHARDAHARPPDTQAARAHDTPGHAARDALKLRMLQDPEARKAARRAYRQKVEAAEAEYAARHARPEPGDQARVPGQLQSREPKPEHRGAETRDKPNGRIASRDLPGHKEETRKRKAERSWLPSNETSQVIVSVDALFTVVNASYHVVPGKADSIAAAALGVAVAGVAWANKRWRDRHGDRPEG